MTTTIVCIGDAHFGPNGRNGDRRLAFLQILQYGCALPALGAWVLAGDLNDAKMTIDDRNWLAEHLQQMAARAPVVIVAGNHDAPGDLEIFGRLATRYPIVVVTAPEVHRLTLATGGAASIACVPYVHRAALVAAGLPHDDLGAAARQLLEPIFIDAAQQLDEARARGDVALFVGHMNVGGSIASTGQPQIGQEIELDPALLARLGHVPKILGHIHRHQEIYGAWYLGSIARMDFGEQESKVFGVLSFEAAPDPLRRFGLTWSLDFLPIDVPRQLHIEGELTREAFTWHVVGEGPLPSTVAETVAGADLRVRYRFNPAEIGALDLAKVYAEFAGCRSLKLEPIAERAHDVRAPEVAAAVTLEDKIRRFAESRGLVITSTLIDKLTALQAHDGERVLTDVATRLGGLVITPAVVEQLAEATL